MEAHLMFIETSEEQDFLKTTVETLHPGGQFWIGVEKDLNGKQVWMDGTSITYQNFGDMNEDGECFRLTTSEQNYKWLDRVCSYTFQYICEKTQVNLGLSIQYVYTR